MSMITATATDFETVPMTDEELADTHPGRTLEEDFLTPLRITRYRVAKEIGLSPSGILDIIEGRRAISPETGLLLDRYFGMSDGFFGRLQSHYDLVRARIKMADRLAKIVPAPREIP
jgi:addiction module HigA family antidote